MGPAKACSWPCWLASRPQSGTVRTEGATPAAIGYLPQATAIQRGYPVSVLEFAALARWREFDAFGRPSYGLLPEVMVALGAVGLQDKAAAPISASSVGQFRRLLFARLIVQQARLVLLDEPFAAIDAQPRTTCWPCCAAGTRRAAR